MSKPTASLLLVDDEEMNRDMLGRRLELHGYRITFAETAGGVDWSSRAFDLVLLDVMMPEIERLPGPGPGPRDLFCGRTAGDHGDGQDPKQRRGRGLPATVPTTTSPSRSTSRSRWRGSRRTSRTAVRSSAARERDALRPGCARAPMTGSGTGTCAPKPSTTRRAGSRCSVSTRARSAPATMEWLDRVHPEDLPRSQGRPRRPPAGAHAPFRVRVSDAGQGPELSLDAQPRSGDQGTRRTGPRGWPARRPTSPAARWSTRSTAITQSAPLPRPAGKGDRAAQARSRSALRGPVPRPRSIQGGQR